LQKGAILRVNDIAFKGPSFGIPARFMDAVVGMKLLKDVTVEEPIRWEDFKE
jgi:sialic acid synthase SpsE